MSVRKNIFVFIIIGTIALPTAALFAASSKITGVVTDVSTGEPLPGANVFLEGTAIGAATGIDGYFVIPQVMPGNYILKVLYIGYKSKEMKVHVIYNQELKLKIGLEFVAIEAGEVIIVSAQAEGQIKAINRQLTARAITNIVSEARIQELPDANAAEALGRLSGVTINRSGGEASSVNVRGQSGGSNTFYIEGMRMVGSEGRGVGLSNISSSMIGGIEIQKSFMPDQDGDVSGGGISFRLKKADPGLKMELLLRQGYNGLTESYDMRDGSITVSDRFFENKLGVLANLVFDQKDRSLDLLSGEYIDKSKPIDSNDLPGVNPWSGSFTRRGEQRKRWGLTYNIDYELPNHKIAFNGFLAALARDVVENSNSVLKTPQGVSYNGTTYLEDDKSYVMGLSGEHRLFNMAINWGASYSGSDKKRPGVYSISASNNHFYFVNWETADNVADVFSAVSDEHDLQNTHITATSFNTQDKIASEGALHLDLELPFKISSLIAGYIKLGGKYRNTNRAFEELGSEVAYATPKVHRIEGTALLDTLYPELDLSFADNNILSYKIFSKDERLPFTAEDNVDIFFPTDFDILKEAINRTKHEYRRDLDLESGNYDNNEILAAGYLMAGIELGPWFTFTPGVRFESFTGHTDAMKYVADPSRIGYQVPGDIEPVSATSKNKIWLPMFTLQVKPREWFDIRASITKTLQRPDFHSMSPRSAESTEFHRNFGNPLLKPARSQNYDLYFSFYENHVGLFTAGVFRKNIEDEINQVARIVLDPEAEGLPKKYRYKTFSSFENNQFYSYIQGLEIDWQTNFWYLPYYLNGIVLNLNYTLLETESKRRFFFEKSETISVYPFRKTVFIDSFQVNNVLGSPDQTFKLSLGYEKAGFSGRVSLYYQARAQSWVTPYKNRNQATDELYRWDIQLSQQIIDGLKFYLNMNNIANWPDVSSMMYFPDTRTNIENYGWSIDVGFRYQL